MYLCICLSFFCVVLHEYPSILGRREWADAGVLQQMPHANNLRNITTDDNGNDDIEDDEYEALAHSHR